MEGSLIGSSELLLSYLAAAAYMNPWIAMGRARRILTRALWLVAFGASHLVGLYLIEDGILRMRGGFLFLYGALVSCYRFPVRQRCVGRDQRGAEVLSPRLCLLSISPSPFSGQTLGNGGLGGINHTLQRRQCVVASSDSVAMCSVALELYAPDEVGGRGTR